MGSAMLTYTKKRYGIDSQNNYLPYIIESVLYHGSRAKLDHQIGV